jgi:copper homeostasis protein
MTPRVAIVGGGLAGLTAARRLLERNVEVVLIDKGRRAGGRLCTRAVALPDGRTATFDLGPPLLYARTRGDRKPPPAHRIHQLVGGPPGGPTFVHRTAGRFRAAGEPVGAPELHGIDEPHGCTVTGGMRELAFRITRHHPNLDFHDHTRAETLERTPDGWKIHTRSLLDDSTAVHAVNALVLTPPTPQALQLLADSGVTLPDDLRDALGGVTYSRCFAVYGVFGPFSEPQVPEGGAWADEGPFEWVTDNALKAVSAVPHSITALTRHDWAERHWNLTDNEVLQRLLPPLRAWVANPVSPDQVFLHRWAYAQPLTPLRQPCAVVRDLGLVLAGDGFASLTPDAVDAAVVSGEGAADRAQALITALVRTSDRYAVPRPTRIALEIAVCTPDEAQTAVAHGADRVELSSGLEVGGLTPSLGLFRQTRDAVDVPIYALLRPRSGGFCYTRREFDAMSADAEALLAAGAAGLVFGVLTPDGRIDRDRCRALVDLAGGKAVFHRAFDFLPDPLAALDELIDLGFERVLTSGGARTAEAGATRLAALVQHAGWQIGVLPAGKILPENVADLVRETRCDQVHAAVRVGCHDPAIGANERLAPGLGGGTETSGTLVAGLRRQLDRLSESQRTDA